MPIRIKIVEVPKKPLSIITDLEILVVLITRLLRQNLSRLVKEIEPVELWDEG
jgi:hypothetical protein